MINVSALIFTRFGKKFDIVRQMKSLIFSDFLAFFIGKSIYYDLKRCNLDGRTQDVRRANN